MEFEAILTSVADRAEFEPPNELGFDQTQGNVLYQKSSPYHCIPQSSSSPSCCYVEVVCLPLWKDREGQHCLITSTEHDVTKADIAASLVAPPANQQLRPQRLLLSQRSMECTTASIVWTSNEDRIAKN